MLKIQLNITEIHHISKYIK